MEAWGPPRGWELESWIESSRREFVKKGAESGGRWGRVGSVPRTKFASLSGEVCGLPQLPNPEEETRESGSPFGVSEEPARQGDPGSGWERGRAGSDGASAPNQGRGSGRAGVWIVGSRLTLEARTGPLSSLRVESAPVGGLELPLRLESEERVVLFVCFVFRI